MHRSRALVNTVLSALHYRNGGNLNFNAGTPIRFLAIASPVDTAAPGQTGERRTDSNKEQSPDDGNVSSTERKPVRFGTLQFLLQRRMPINSLRLLNGGIRLAFEERRAEDMVPYLGPWMAQVTRPEILERTMPWTVADIILYDLSRLARLVGVNVVRDALPQKHLQSLANHLVVQGFDKLTPIQLARAASTFSLFRPWIPRASFDRADLDTGTGDSPTSAVAVWPSTDWADELVDYLHNLKANTDLWNRTSSFSLSTTIMALALSHYKPRQPTFQAMATAMKEKLEEQLKTGYTSRQALSTTAIAWNVWRVNPEEYAPGFWDVYMKSVAKCLEEYVDSIPDPPGEDELGGTRQPAATNEGQEEGQTKGRQFARNSVSLIGKRRDLRNLLASVALATKNFSLNKQFNEIVKTIWEQRVDEHAQFMNGVNARRITNVCDDMGVTLKPQTREKLMTAASRYSANRRQGGGGLDVGGSPRENRDVDDFDDLRGQSRSENFSKNRGPVGGGRPQARGDAFDDYEDFRPSGGGRGGAPRSDRGGGDFDDFRSGSRGGAPRGDRGGGRGRRDDDDFGFDKPF